MHMILSSHDLIHDVVDIIYRLVLDITICEDQRL